MLKTDLAYPEQISRLSFRFNKLAIGSYEGLIGIYDLKSAEQIADFRVAEMVTAIWNNQNFVLIGQCIGPLKIFSLSGNEVFADHDCIDICYITETNGFLLLGSYSGSIYLYKVDVSGEISKVSKTFQPHESKITGIYLLGNMLLSTAEKCSEIKKQKFPLKLLE